ncbi:hypothetical protein [Micromonospora sp. NPDC048830]|uniref:hypothetical protein n=1 Tax=Micromonospora sp. NPDC048830 TaxID=3364257 RepID=UPI0037197E8F
MSPRDELLPAPAVRVAAQERRSPSDGRLTTALVLSLSLALVVFVPSLRHWLMVPVTLSGILIGVDTVAWFHRRTDVFDPRAYLGLMGFHFFYVAPILQVGLDHWSPRIYDPPDWPNAIGAMAVLNTLGLALYRVVLALPARRGRRRHRPARQLDVRAFWWFGLLAVAVSFAAFGVEVAMFGGLSGFVEVMTGSYERPELAGLGWFLLITEAFPALLVAMVLVRWRSALARRPGLLILLMTGLAVTQFFVSGLKGSRSSTMWPVLLCLIIIHLLVRRIPRRALFAVVAVLLVYMYGYGLYKSAGPNVLAVANGTRSVEEVSSATGRDLPTLLTGDFGRADVQAVVLDRHLHGEAEPVLGSTYLNAMTLLLPDALLPYHPVSKVEVGSVLLYGPTILESEHRSSKVYGLAGEAIINFGPVGGLLSFAVLGLVVRAVRRYYLNAVHRPDLAPKLLAPMAWTLVGIVSADLDNVVFFQLKYALPLVAVVLLSRRLDRGSRPAVPQVRPGSSHRRAGAHRIPAGR